ncbi:MAG: right-handed parallel beta-helix repeat-containing protein [Candidatus Desulforudis sp.]|nr:right-handed parallel beta-helix repeat-containing protein [Desulforudis sp.]
MGPEPEGQYPSISAAVCAAQSHPDSTVRILVYSGTYDENVEILVPGLRLEGLGSPAEVVVQAADLERPAIEVSANNVTITNLTVTRSTGGSGAGIIGKDVCGLTVRGVIATGNRRGIFLRNANACTIKDTEARNNLDWGISFLTVRDSIITANWSTDNTKSGVRITGATNHPSDSNMVRANYIARNECGVSLTPLNVTNTRVEWNHFQGNLIWGVESELATVIAPFNWWNAPEGPKTDLNSSSGEKVSDTVKYAPWLGTPPEVVHRTVYQVPDQYTRAVGIPDTVAALHPGDTLILTNGTYEEIETLVLDRGITLRGQVEGASRPVLAPSSGPALVITAGHVTVQGLAFVPDDAPAVMIVGADETGQDSPTGVVLGGPAAGHNPELSNTFPEAAPGQPVISLADGTRISATDVDATHNDWGAGATRESIAELLHHQDQDPALGRITYLPAYAAGEIIHPELAITTTSLPPATAGEPYEFTLEAFGGDGHYTWQANDPLPEDLLLAEDGRLRGTPVLETGGKTFSFTVRVTEGAGQQACATLTLNIAEGDPNIDPGTPGDPGDPDTEPEDPGAQPDNPGSEPEADPEPKPPAAPKTRRTPVRDASPPPAEPAHLVPAMPLTGTGPTSRLLSPDYASRLAATHFLPAVGAYHSPSTWMLWALAIVADLLSREQ